MPTHDIIDNRKEKLGRLHQPDSVIHGIGAVCGRGFFSVRAGRASRNGWRAWRSCGCSSGTRRIARRWSNWPRATGGWNWWRKRREAEAYPNGADTKKMGQNYVLRELRVLFATTTDEDQKAMINVLGESFPRSDNT